MLAVSGLASGLDTGAIVSQLMELERRPIIPLQEREANFQVELSAYGTLQGLLDDLKSAGEALRKSTNLKGFDATSSDPALFTATAEATALPGLSHVTVHQLAQSQTLRSAGFTAGTATLGEGVLHLQVGSGTLTTIDIAATDTIRDVATAINEASAGVNAAVIFDGTEYILTLGAEASGVQNVIRATVTDNDGNHTDQAGLSRLVYDAGVTENLTETQTPQDALIDVAGITGITRSSNTITEVIPGIALELLAEPEEPDNTATLTVTRQSGNIREQLQGFFDAYNALQDFFTTEQAFDVSTDTAGTLLGDSTTSLIRRRLSSAITNPLSGFDSRLNALADLGIGTDASGKLEFSSDSLLDDALEEDPNAVFDFFTSNTETTKGFAVQLVETVEGFLQTENGILTSRQKGVNTSIKRIKADIEQIEERAETTQQRLEAQFRTLETTISQLLSTEAFLSQQLVNLQNLSAAIANRS